MIIVHKKDILVYLAHDWKTKYKNVSKTMSLNQFTVKFMYNKGNKFLSIMKMLKYLWQNV